MADDRKRRRTVPPRHLRYFVPVADGGRERTAPRGVHVHARSSGSSQHIRLTEARWRLYSTCFSLAAFGLAGYATLWELMTR
jgi:hypothetical protein